MNKVHNLNTSHLSEKTSSFEYVQKISTFPEYNAALAYDQKMSFKEWLGSIEPIQKIIFEAMTYFYQKERDVMNSSVTNKELNPWYIYILQQCIELVESKRQINDKLGEYINAAVYEQMTGRRGYTWTLWLAKILATRFLSPVAFERFGDKAIERDDLEQAARICDYALKYFNGYKTTHVDRYNDIWNIWNTIKADLTDTLH